MRGSTLTWGRAQGQTATPQTAPTLPPLPTDCDHVLAPIAVSTRRTRANVRQGHSSLDVTNHVVQHPNSVGTATSTSVAPCHFDLAKQQR